MIFFNRRSPWWTISSEVTRYDKAIKDAERNAAHARSAMWRYTHRVNGLKSYRKQAFEEMLQMQAWEDDGGISW